MYGVVGAFVGWQLNLCSDDGGRWMGAMNDAGWRWMAPLWIQGGVVGLTRATRTGCWLCMTRRRWMRAWYSQFVFDLRLWTGLRESKCPDALDVKSGKVLSILARDARIPAGGRRPGLSGAGARLGGSGT